MLQAENLTKNLTRHKRQRAEKRLQSAFISSPFRSWPPACNQPTACTPKHMRAVSMQTPSKSETPKDSMISRRAILLTAALTTSALLPLEHEALAYSSPYKPGTNTEQALPERLYESETRRVVTTPSGLQYFDILPGTGPEASIGNVVLVYYTSRLRGLYGIKISSTYDDPTTPPYALKLGANDVVPGVSEALTGMKVGGKRRAVLPPNIGYKNPDMKPAVTEFFARRRLLSVLETNRDATIVFDFELVKVK